MNRYDKEKQKQGIFGTPLEEVMTRIDHQNKEIPIIVEQCLKYLDGTNKQTNKHEWIKSNKHKHKYEMYKINKHE